MIINKALLDDLSAKAKVSPYLRQSFDLRTSIADQSQRVLNALEPGTVVPIHRHTKSTETVVLLRGKIKQIIFDEDGNVIDSYIVAANSETCGYSLLVGQWHTTECLESGTIMFECKDGAYEPLSIEDIMQNNG